MNEKSQSSPGSPENPAPRFEEKEDKEPECDRLRDSLLKMQDELEKSREQNEALLAKYEKAQEELLNCHERISQKENAARQQRNELDSIKKSAQAESMASALGEVGDNSKFRVANYQRELWLKDSEISGLKQSVEEKNGTLATVKVVGDQYRVRSEIAQQLADDKDATIADLKTKVESLQNELDDLYIRRKAEGTAILEVEHLQADNRRLVGTLKGTKEYKEFAEFFEDSGGAMRLATRDAGGKRSSRRAQKPASDQAAEWVPQDVSVFQCYPALDRRTGWPTT